MYAKARTVAGLVAIGYLVGIEPIETFHLFVVQYGADDVVKLADVIRSDDGCTPEGICLSSVFDSLQGRGLAYKGELEDAVIFARLAEDTASKSFPVLPEQCSIYLYYENDSLAWPLLSVYQSEHGYTKVHEAGYLHWIMEPGVITVKAYIANLGTEMRTELEMDSEPGGIYFLKAWFDLGFFRRSTLTFSIQGAETGKLLVNKRRLVLE